MAGRPSIYSAGLAEIICERMADGESVRRICRDPAMPGMSTIFRWVAENEVFREQYEKSRGVLLEHWAEEILDIADDGTNDWTQKLNEDGTPNKTPNGDYKAFNAEHVQRSRLRVDSRKWLLSKLLPKKYGDKLEQNVTGGMTLQLITGVPRPPAEEGD